MKVLQANKFFYVRGGAERYFLDLVDLLPGHGHPVAPFSMHHPRNQPSRYSPHFVQQVDYQSELGPVGSVAAAARTLYNRETARRVKDLVREFEPDVAHLHNVHHQLSGSLIETLHGLGVPIVQTLHDFQWVCPVYTFLRGDTVCEECGHGRYRPAVVHRCHSGSLARSAVAALELKIGYQRGWEGMVARFLAPSDFLRRKVVEHGLCAERVIPFGYCLRLEGYEPGHALGSYVLYAGRLSREKGVATLIRAAARVPRLELRIAGTGPLEPELRRLAETIDGDRIRFLGYLDETTLREQVRNAACVVVPSEWYENQPFAVLESFALGTPVVGAEIGGIPELVIPEKTGLLFPARSVEALADALDRMVRHPQREEMGRRARLLVEERFDPHRHVERLLGLYREVIA